MERRRQRTAQRHRDLRRRRQHIRRQLVVQPRQGFQHFRKRLPALAQAPHPEPKRIALHQQPKHGVGARLYDARHAAQPLVERRPRPLTVAVAERHHHVVATAAVGRHTLNRRTIHVAEAHSRRAVRPQRHAVCRLDACRPPQLLHRCRRRELQLLDRTGLYVCPAQGLVRGAQLHLRAILALGIHEPLPPRPPRRGLDGRNRPAALDPRLAPDGLRLGQQRLGQLADALILWRDINTEEHRQHGVLPLPAREAQPREAALQRLLFRHRVHALLHRVQSMA